MHINRLGTLYLVLVLLLASCQSGETTNSKSPVSLIAWRPENLNLLRLPPDAAGGSGISGIYSRIQNDDLQIRLDFLDLPVSPDIDVYLAIDSKPGGSTSLPIQAQTHIAWDLLVKIPSTGRPQAFLPTLAPEGILIPRPRWDITTSTLVVSLTRTRIPVYPARFSFEVLITPANQTRVIDLVGPVQSETIFLGKAPVLLAFWDTLPAVTPAQVLRRWDGAHTGPLGQRHGLKILLDAARQTALPVVLLDLKTPESLSGLDAVGGLPLLRQLADQGLASLPDVNVGDPTLIIGSEYSRGAAAVFQLPASSILYGNGSEPLSTHYTAVFSELPDTSHIVLQKGLRIIPLPGQTDQALTNSVDRNGPDIQLRKALLQIALSPDTTDLLVLGGSLPASLWGDSSIALPVFQYLAAHPWIEVLDGPGLSSFTANRAAQDLQSQPQGQATVPDPIVSNLRSRLLQAPENSITQLAWEMYQRLKTPTSDPALRAIRSTYLGQVGSILAASEWAQHPVAISDCTHDIDYDGQPECLLATNQIFTVLENDGARLSFAFAHLDNGYAQIIGPFSQFAAGMSDPSTWKPGSGIYSDPSEIPGAFSDPPENLTWYTAVALPNKIEFFDSQNNLVRSYQLTGDEILVQNNASTGGSFQIPLALSPQSRFSPAWKELYHLKTEGNRVIWRADGMATVRIQGDETFSAIGFTDSLPGLTSPEDPNLDYPPGAYIPFPMVLVAFQSEGPFLLSIKISN